MNIACPASLFLVLLTAPSCSRGKDKSPELIEANRLHLEAMKTAEQLELMLDSLAGRAADGIEKSRIDSLKNLVEMWEKNVIEVPGFAHEHHHASGAHSHEHKSAPPMTDESMLDYQRQSKEAIIELKKVVEKPDGLLK